MKTFLRTLFVPLAIIGLFDGCTEPVEPTPVTYSQLLTGTTKKSWRLVSFQEIDDGVASGVTNISLILPPCEADDLYTFYANEERKFEYSNGASKCAASEPDVYLEDSWALINSNATIEMVIPVLTAQKLPYIVKNLTANSMTVELYFQNLGDDLNASYRFTFNSTTR